MKAAKQKRCNSGMTRNARSNFREIEIYTAHFASHDEKGRVLHHAQATVECAFLIPAMLLLLMLLIQPGILLYNYMVMKGAAAEGCRLLITKTDELAGQDVYEASIRRHLGSIPQQENFHVHNAGCSWEITLEGNEITSEVCVGIKNQVKLLPFFDFAAQSLGLTNESGNFVQSVEIRQAARSTWVQNSEDGTNPKDWVHRDDELLEGR